MLLADEVADALGVNMEQALQKAMTKVSGRAAVKTNHERQPNLEIEP